MEHYELEIIDDSTAKIKVDCDSIYADTIQNLIDEMKNITIEELTWRSKYNSFVIYDYEPFCVSGFKKCTTISGEYKFLTYLIEKVIGDKEHLERCFNIKDEKRAWLFS